MGRERERESLSMKFLGMMTGMEIRVQLILSRATTMQGKDAGVQPRVRSGPEER